MATTSLVVDLEDDDDDDDGRRLLRGSRRLLLFEVGADGVVGAIIVVVF